MKRHQSIKSFLKITSFVLPFAIGISTSSQSWAEKLVFACSPWLPYTDPSLDQNGILGHMAAEAAETAGLDIEIQFLPWKRAVNLIKAGKITGSFCVGYDDSRTEWLDFVKTPLIETTAGIFSLTDKPITADTVADLSNYRIGVLTDGKPEKYLLKEGNNSLSLIHYQNEESGMKMLAGKRFDLIVKNKRDGLTLLSQKMPELKDKITYSQDLYGSKVHMAISQKWPNAGELANQLDQALQKMKQSGRFEALYKQHNF